MSTSSGGDDRYSFNSNIDNHDDDENPLSYFDAAAAALKPPASPSSDSSSSTSSETPQTTNKQDLLDDIPVGTRVLATLAPAEPDDKEETIVFDDRPSPRREGSHRANQDYYDVLQMASNRLQQDSSVINYDSSGDEAVRKTKKKKKKKKEKRRSQRRTEDEEGNVDGARRSAVFQSLFPPSMMSSHKGINKKPFESSLTQEELAKIGSTSFSPTQQLQRQNPSMWNPAALVTAAQSSKIDTRGFYKKAKGRADSAYGKVQTLVQGKQDDMPNDFNLHDIGKSKKKKKEKKKYKSLTRCDSIDWGDDSILSGLKDGEEVDDDDSTELDREAGGIEMVDGCSYELNGANQKYLANQQLVEIIMLQKVRRRIGIILIAVILFLSVCLGLYLSRSRDANDKPTASTMATEEYDVGIDRTDAPDRPLSQTPVHPVDGYSESSVQTMTATNLQYIVNQITPDPTVLSNPRSSQAKALEWCKNDLKIYKVAVASRVVQRYILATLYYATNGTGWSTNTNWGDGHECEWYGIGCETGENDVAMVTYIDLNSNHLDGTIPQEIGYIGTLEQVHLWGNKLIGSIPNTMSQLQKLNTLYLDKNYLDGEMGDTFNLMKSLKHLDLSGNRLRGHIPHGLGTLTNLRDLRLSNNLLSSTFPTSLISLSNLQTLLLDSNSISGSLPGLVGEMRSLVTIRIQDNDLKGKLPSFSDTILLEEAHLDGNYFTGTIPDFGSTRLREVYLGSNALTGRIPESIGDLVKLEIFSASFNKLNSTIPSSISRATQLNILDLSHNKLSGEIPEEAASLVNMHELRLDHNHFSGFPNWLGSMSHLEIVHLNNNLLDETLDLSLDFGDLDDLTEFTIEYNDLMGVVDEFMCDLLLDVLTSDCYGTPAQVDCPCCTECF